MIEQAIEHGAYDGDIRERVALSSAGRFNAKSSFMLTPDSDPAIFSQIEGLSLRLTGVASTWRSTVQLS